MYLVYRGRKWHVSWCMCNKRVCASNNEPKACSCRYLQYIRISVFVQSRRVHMLIVNCLLKNKFNIHVIYYLYISVNTISQIFKLNYNWRHCSAISLTKAMLCVRTKRVCVCDNKLVCKTVRLAFSCQTSAISLPFILIPSLFLFRKIN